MYTLIDLSIIYDNKNKLKNKQTLMPTTLIEGIEFLHIHLKPRLKNHLKFQKIEKLKAYFRGIQF